MSFQVTTISRRRLRIFSTSWPRRPASCLRGAQSHRGAGSDDIHHRLGLRQVHLTIEKGSLCLIRLGSAARAPTRKTAAKRRDATSTPPWQCNSAISSPVCCAALRKMTAMPSSSRPSSCESIRVQGALKKAVCWLLLEKSYLRSHGSERSGQLNDCNRASPGGVEIAAMVSSISTFEQAWR